MNEKQEQIMADIDDAIGPDEMSQAEALEFLKDIRSSIDSRIGAIREDIERG